MSKELEALERLYKSATGYAMVHKKHDKEILKQALTPPTEQEVCEALSEWFGDDFYYDVNQKEFYTKALNGQHSVVKLKNNEIHFGGWFTMPLHLVEMIGKFYKGKVKENE